MLFAFLLACEEPKPATLPPSRFDAVMSKTPKTDEAIGAFCENRDTSASAPEFVWPEMETPAPPKSSSWRWVNIWATWCKPCVEEMPRLVGWKSKLAEAGIQVEMEFISVDAAAEDVSKFMGAHPEFPKSSRVKEFSTVAGWLAKLGFDASTSIPIHLFVDADNKVRCTRVGSVGEPDYATVKSLLKL